MRMRESSVGAKHVVLRIVDLLVVALACAVVNFDWRCFSAGNAISQ
jgi:hypothetical protein